MKRVFTSLALLALITPLFVACDEGGLSKKPTNPGENPGEDFRPDNPSELTPGEHKSKLEDIAIDFLNYIEPSDSEDIVRVCASLAEYLEDFDEDYIYAVDAVNELRLGAQNLSAYNFTNFATRVTEEYIVDVNDPDFNPFGGYSYEYSNCEWIETEISNSHSTIFKWDDAVAELSWGDTKREEWIIDSEDVGATVYVPETITFVLTIGNVEHLYINIKPNITNSKTLAPTVEARLYGGYTLSSNHKADSRGLESHASLKKGDQTLINGNIVVAINDMTDLNNWVDEYYCEGCEEYHVDLDPSEYFAENVKTGQLQIDILNLSIIGVGDFKGMAEQIEEIDDRYDPWEDEHYDESVGRAQAVEYCDLINKKASLALVYNDTNEHIAQIVMQVTKHKSYDYYWDEDEYEYVEYEYSSYDIEPILLFPDESKYAFETYFTERAFRNLINTAEALAEEFEEIFSDIY